MSVDIENDLTLMRRLLEEGRRDEAMSLLESLLPADKAALFEELDHEDQGDLFAMAQPQDAADILEELDDDDAAALAEQMDTATLTQVLDEMEPDEAADLLGDLSPDLRSEVLQGMEESAEIRPLLRYPDDSAGGLMTSEYYVFDDQSRVGQVFRAIRERPAPGEEIPYVYAVDGEGRLTGMARLADLIRAHPEQPLSAIARPEAITVSVYDDQESAARLLNRYDLMAIAVLDEGGRLAGVITADDAIAAQEQEASEDIYKGAGILSIGGREAARSDLLVRGPLWRAWWVRIPFLVVTLLGGMLAGAVIGAYEETLEAIIVLALFIPVLMNVGGNAGSQSSEIFIRGHALEQIDTSRFAKYLFRELAVGVGLGAIMGLLGGIIAWVWQGIPEIGLVVGLSMIASISLATFLGAMIPLALDRLGLDPAAGASPFITTIKDITSVFIYFLLATLFLGHLL